MKRFYLLSLMALVSAFAPAFLSAKTIILKQIAVTPLEGDTMFFNIDEYEKATFELTQTSPASRYLMLRRNDGAAVRIYLDEVKGITYKETTQTIDDPIEAPKVGDYYYSDGTWSDGGLISINADGTSPVWAEEKPAPVEGKTVIGIVAMTDPSRMAQSDIDAGYTHGYVISTKFVHDPGNKSSQTNQVFTSIKYSYDEGFEANVPVCKAGSTWYADLNGRQYCDSVISFYGDMLLRDCPAVYYTSIKEHPSTSSPWFVPSTGQLWDIVANLCGDAAAKALLSWRTVASDATYYCYSEIKSDPMAIFNATLDKVPASDKELLVRVDYDDYLWDPFQYKPTDYHAYCPLWTSCRYDTDAMCIFEVPTLRTTGTSKIECMAEWFNGDCYLRPILAF